MKRHILIILMFLCYNAYSISDTAKIDNIIRDSDSVLYNSVEAYLNSNLYAGLFECSDDAIIIKIDNAIFYTLKKDVFKILSDMYIEFSSIEYKSFDIIDQKIEDYYIVDVDYLNEEKEKFATIKFVFHRSKLKQIHFL